MPKPKATWGLLVRADVEDLGVVEDSWVAVGGAVEQQKLVACANVLPVQLVVDRGSAAHVRDRRHPADELLDRDRVEQLGLIEQESSADPVAGRGRESSIR